MSCEHGTFLLKLLVKYCLRYEPVKATTLSGHLRPLLGIVLDYHMSSQTFTSQERCPLEEHVIPTPQLLQTCTG